LMTMDNVFQSDVYLLERNGEWIASEQGCVAL
jgi:hypothetical protein